MRALATAIVAMLFAGMMSGCGIFGHADQTKSMGELSAACLQYASDHNQEMPMRPDSLKPDYLSDSFNFKNYKIIMINRLSSCRNPSRTLMLCDTRQLADGRRVVAFADGRVAIISSYNEQTRIRILTMACLAFTSYNRGRLPSHLEDVKKVRLLAPDFDLEHFQLCAAGKELMKMPLDTVLLQEKEANGGARWLSYIDGQVELVTE